MLTIKLDFISECKFMFKNQRIKYLFYLLFLLTVACDVAVKSKSDITLLSEEPILKASEIEKISLKRESSIDSPYTIGDIYSDIQDGVYDDDDTEIKREMFRFEIDLTNNKKTIEFFYAELSHQNNTWTTVKNEYCLASADLSSTELDSFIASYENLNVCQVERVNSNEGGGASVTIGVPVGTDLFLGTPHFIEVFELGASEPLFQYDFLQHYYSGYKHNMICGDRDSYMDQVKALVATLVTSDCPSNYENLFKTSIE